MSNASAQRPRAVATIGVFDGVHRGHQVLITRVVTRAREQEVRPALITFDPPPGAVLQRPQPAAELTPCSEKADQIRALGIREPIVLRFTRELAQRPPDDFVRAELQSRLTLVGLVIGYDFRFGHRGAGDAAQLAEIGRREGFWVEEQSAICWDGAPISSTRIRAALAAGEVASAAAMLGRPYSIVGRVTGGRGLGSRELVPTANLVPPDGKLLPRPGVYLAEVRVAGCGWDAVAHVGTAPTVGDEEGCRVETHLLDFRGELGGRLLEVRFLERLRAPVRFPDLTALREAIAADIVKARIRLAARRAAADRPGDAQNGLANPEVEC